MEHMDGLEVTSCERCPALVDSRSRIVNGSGPADADLVFVGEAPGNKEDQQGTPFVGRSGTILDDALRAVGLSREDIRITNCVRCHPSENRDPTTEELSNCRGHLKTEFELLDPELVVTLGKVPSEHLLNRSVAVTTEAGELSEVRLSDVSYPVLICVHPAATLYDRSQEETFTDTVAKAAELTGGRESSGGQSRLEEF